MNDKIWSFLDGLSPAAVACIVMSMLPIVIMLWVVICYFTIPKFDPPLEALIFLASLLCSIVVGYFLSLSRSRYEERRKR